jgi:pre-rRNA-processing protein IPI3
MPQEVLLTTSSSEDSSILLHDLHTSNNIQEFRDANVSRNGIAMTPNQQFLSVQRNKGLLDIYSWGKPTINSKMVLPEKLLSIKVSPSGTWCAGGSESGRLFVWEVNLQVSRILMEDC